MLMQPFYIDNNWRSGIDINSIDYDKSAGIISFTTIGTKELNNTTIKTVSGMKIYVRENKIFRTGSIGYFQVIQREAHIKVENLWG